MRYFSIASRCRILGTLSNARTISYKTRKNLMSLVNDMMRQGESSQVDGINYTETKSRKCVRFSMYVVGSGASESNSLYINTDFVRYLFNCGEGFQRMASEHGMKLAKTNTVFVTHHSWRNIGGLMGFALTQQGYGVKEIFVYGPPAIKDIVLGSRAFVSLKSTSLNIVVDKPRLKYDDSYLQVQFVPLYKESSKHMHKSTSDSDLVDQSNHKSSQTNSHKSHSNRSHSEARKPTHPVEDYVLCYICETPEYGGHLNLKLCLEKGVPPGPMLGMLKSKKDVRLQDGTIVYWKDVLQTSTIGSSLFIVADCPTEDYLESLLSEKEFVKHQYDSKAPPKVVVHFTVPRIMRTPQYREWMSRFPSSTVHLRINSDNTSMSHIDVHRLQMKLHLLNPAVFPLLDENNVPVVRDEMSGKLEKNNYSIFSCFDEEAERNLSKAFGQNDAHRVEFSSLDTLESNFRVHSCEDDLRVINGITTLQIHVTPRKRYDYSHAMCIDRAHCMKEVREIKDLDEELAKLKDFAREWESSEECKAAPEYPKILFLGTGSSVPFKTRNTSGILVEVNERSMILMDCGEGTYAQMQRFFGRERLREVFRKLKLIYVSHPHADHHVGLISLLEMRQTLLREARAAEEQESGKEESSGEDEDEEDMKHLLLLVPDSVKGWLELNNNITDVLLYDTRIVLNSSAFKMSNVIRRYIRRLGLSSLQTVPVVHCFQSTAITFVDEKGFKVAYSGDCLPCGKLIEAGKHCDILIHEATFEDGMENMAKVKKHTTISQAIEVGENMNAKFVLLTHFSQRYSHLPQLRKELPDNAGIAFDNMMVNAKVLPLLPKMVKLYKMLFADKVVGLNSKTLKRILKERPEDDIATKIKVIN